MAFHLTKAVGEGTRRVLTRTGGILFVTLLAIQFLVQASINTAVFEVLPPAATGDVRGLGLILPVSSSVAVVLFVVALVLSSAYFVALSRALTRPTEELSSFPGELYKRRIGWATLTVVLGGLVVGISVSIGLLLFVLPGIFLSACFLCFIFAVGVEDRGAVDALRRSWGLSRGNRLKLSVIVVFSGIIGGVIGIVGTILDLVAAPILAEVLGNTLSTVLFVFLYGVMAASYLQLREERTKSGRDASGVDDVVAGRDNSGVDDVVAGRDDSELDDSVAADVDGA